MSGEKHTPGPWRAVAQGGSSTVITQTEPSRNDTRIPPYGHRPEMGYCLGYPFIEEDRSVRYDFVCFSHDDARLIAAAPDLLAALRAIVASIERTGHADEGLWHDKELPVARTAIQKATGHD